MSYPTNEQLASWANTLTRTNWTHLTTRLTHAIERDRRGGSALPDGYPTGHTGTTNGTLTTVEAAAHARTTARDEHHDRTRQAVAYLEQTVLSLAALTTQLDRIEARAHQDTALEPGCRHHAAFDLREERYRGDLCERCYRFKLEYGVVPPAKLIDDHARGIRWTDATINRALTDVCNR